MSNKMNKRFTISFDGDISSLSQDVSKAKTLLRSVGLEAAKVQTATNKAGVTTHTISGTSQADTTAIAKKLEHVKALNAAQNQGVDVMRRATVVETGYSKKVNTNTTRLAANQKQLKKVENGVAGVTKQHRLGVKHVLKYSGAYAAAGAAMAGSIAAISSIPVIGMELQATNSVLEATFGSAQGAATQLAYLDSVADGMSLNIRTLREDYRKFSASTTLVGVSISETQGIFSNMSKVSRALHLNTDEVGGTFRALTQIFNKNKVMAEEAQNQLGERVPGAMALLGKAYQQLTGHSEDAMTKLNKDMEQGLVKPAGLILEFSKVLAEKFTPAFEKSMQGLQAKLVDASNAWTRFAEKAFVASEKFLTQVVQTTTVTLNFLTEHIPEIKTALKTVINVMTVLYTVKFATAIAQTKLLTGATTALSAAQMASVGVFKRSTSVTGGSILSMKGLTTRLKKIVPWVKTFSRGLTKVPNIYAKLIGAAVGLTAITLDIKKVNTAITDHGTFTATTLEMAKELWLQFGEGVSTAVGGIAKEVSALHSNLSRTVEAIGLAIEESDNFFVRAGRTVAGAMAAPFKTIGGLIKGGTQAASDSIEEQKNKLIELAHVRREALKQAEEQAGEFYDAESLRQTNLADIQAAASAKAAADAAQKKIKDDEATKAAETAAKAEARRIEQRNKAFAREMLQMDAKLAELTGQLKLSKLIDAQASGFTATQQEELAVKGMLIEAQEKLNEAREKEADLIANGQKALVGARDKMLASAAELNALMSGASADEAVELSRIEEAVGKLHVSAQATTRELLLQDSVNRKTIAGLQAGLDLVRQLQNELNPSEALSLPDNIDPALAAQAQELSAAIKLKAIEESFRSEEELAQLHYEKQRTFVIENTQRDSISQINLLKKLEAQKTKVMQDGENARRTLTLTNTLTIASGIGEIMAATAGKSEKAQKRALAVQKGVAIAQATLSMFVAASDSMAKGVTIPEKLAAYGIMLSQGASIISAIRSTEVDAGAFATGGAFTVPGTGPTDSRTVRFQATPGERVTVETPQQQRASSSAGSNVQVNIYNETSAQVQAEETTDEFGEKVINIIVNSIAGSGEVADTMQRHYGLSRRAV